VRHDSGVQAAAEAAQRVSEGHRLGPAACRRAAPRGAARRLRASLGSEGNAVIDDKGCER